MRTRSPFLEKVLQGPVLCDGGMGTELYARGISYERCFEQLNLIDPELIETIHLEYVAAGAQIIETNTFGANRYRLAEHGLESSVRSDRATHHDCSQALFLYQLPPNSESAEMLCWLLPCRLYFINISSRRPLAQKRQETFKGRSRSLCHDLYVPTLVIACIATQPKR